MKTKTGDGERINVAIIVDPQTDFVDGVLGTPEAQSVMGNVAAEIRRAEEAGEVIIATKDTHEEETYAKSDECRHIPALHTEKGTDGWQFHGSVRGLLESCEDNIVEKGTFGSMDLGRLLKSIDSADRVTGGRGIGRVRLCCLCTDACVIANFFIVKAALPEASVEVLASACAGITPEGHDTALSAMEAAHGTILGRGSEPWRGQQ